ncbi:hypothetical protein BHE74_00039312 [Ensete ventricosum]|nr:hypothetical protein GW17_00024219 [Ensete ventricosum]RWW54076.1 hypothetical protein BHE74_00039312 [Ensete ventricosum]RZS15184.1 hypothetical protein BHM03_00046990 [Ensete ventricosum]
MISLLNLQATFEDAYVLVGDNFKWFFGSCYQLHFIVVPSSDRCNHIQCIHLCAYSVDLVKTASAGLFAGVFFAKAKLRERSQS